MRGAVVFIINGEPVSNSPEDGSDEDEGQKYEKNHEYEKSAKTAVLCSVGVVYSLKGSFE